MILNDDAKKNAATIVVGIAQEKPSDEYMEMKKEAAQAIVSAVKEDKPEDLMEALSAFIMLCEESD